MGILTKGEFYTTLKTGIVIFAVMIVVIECHAFFQSPWNRAIFMNRTGSHKWGSGGGLLTEGETIYRQCKLLDDQIDLIEKKQTEYNKVKENPTLGARRNLKRCPRVESGLECFFFAVLMITFLCSCASLGMSVFAAGNPLFKLGDKYYHFVAGCLLLVGGIVNIIAADNIHNFLITKVPRYSTVAVPELARQQDGAIHGSVLQEPGISNDFGQFYKGKITAGVFAILISVAYIVTGLLGLML